MTLTLPFEVHPIDSEENPPTLDSIAVGRTKDTDRTFFDVPYIFFVIQGDNKSAGAYLLQSNDGNINTCLKAAEDLAGEALSCLDDLSRYNSAKKIAQTYADMGLLYRTNIQNESFWGAFISGPPGWDNPVAPGGTAQLSHPGTFEAGTTITAEMFVLKSPFPVVASVDGLGVPVDPGELDIVGDTALERRALDLGAEEGKISSWAWTCFHARGEPITAANQPITMCYPMPDVDPTGIHNYIELETAFAQYNYQSREDGSGDWEDNAPYTTNYNRDKTLLLGTGSYMDMRVRDVKLGEVIESSATPSSIGQQSNAIRIPPDNFIDETISIWTSEDTLYQGEYPSNAEGGEAHHVQTLTGPDRLEVVFCNSGWYTGEDADSLSLSERCLFNEDNRRFWKAFGNSWLDQIVEAQLISNEDKKLYEECSYQSLIISLAAPLDHSPSHKFTNVLYGLINVQSAIDQDGVEQRWHGISLCALLDLDDQTLDGNQHTVITSVADTSAADANADGIADSLGAGERVGLESLRDYNTPLETTSKFPPEHRQVEGITGDGVVDMADFRRLRDWLLVAEGLTANMSGTDENYKQDKLYIVEERFEEGLVPIYWADYNKDQQVSLTSKSGTTYYSPFNGTYTELANAPQTWDVSISPEGELTVTPGTLEGEDVCTYSAVTFTCQTWIPGVAKLSDFDVWYNLVNYFGRWNDEHYALADVPQLLNSGDLEVWPHALFSDPNRDIVKVISTVTDVDGNIVGTREHRRDDLDPHSEFYQRQIYTLPVSPTAYEVSIEAIRSDGTPLVSSPVQPTDAAEFVISSAWGVTTCGTLV